MALSEKELFEAIDEFVGSGGQPSRVLEALAEAMWSTAEHVRIHWQDESTARAWDRAGDKVQKLSNKITLD